MTAEDIRHDALYRIDTMLIEDYRRQIRYLEDEPVRILRKLLTDGQMTIMGVPVRFTVEVDGPFTREQVLEWLPEPASTLGS